MVGRVRRFGRKGSAEPGSEANFGSVSGSENHLRSIGEVSVSPNLLLPNQYNSNEVYSTLQFLSVDSILVSLNVIIVISEPVAHRFCFKMAYFEVKY